MGHEYAVGNKLLTKWVVAFNSENDDKINSSVSESVNVYVALPEIKKSAEEKKGIEDAPWGLRHLAIMRLQFEIENFVNECGGYIENNRVYAVSGDDWFRIIYTAAFGEESMNNFDLAMKEMHKKAKV